MGGERVAETRFWYREYGKKARSGDDIVASGRGERFGLAECLKIVAHVARVLAPVRSHRLLDVGCGNGLMAIVLAELCGEVVGVEPVEELAALARRHTRASRAARIVVGESWALPLADRSVDRLLCHGVFQLLEGGDEVERTFAEMARVLRPAGRGLLGAVPDLRMRDRVLGPYLASVEAATHLSPEQKAEIIERNRRGRWYDATELVRLAERHGLAATVRAIPEHLLESSDRFDVVLERR